ncbi:MAG: cation-transporting P-type ATPase [Sphingomonadales bacterium]|nr:cation-transporting P-type ATPase [Sphingomonadales bacterium]
MITGDHPETARTTARRAGIASVEVLTGAEMALLDGEALAHRIARCSVFARISPNRSFRLSRR